MLTSPKLTRRQFGLLAGAAAVSTTFSFNALAQDGKTFVLASNTELDNMDPHTANGNIPTAFFINIYDSLVRIRHNPPVVEPSLATEWTISDDGLVYTFKLQPNAVFHDGSPVTAAAVVYSFDRLVRLGRGISWMINGVVGPGSVVALDDKTVQITLLKPFAPFLQVVPSVFVVNPALVSANLGSDDGETYLRANAAGSGPFMLTRFEAGNLYGFTRFPGFYATNGGNVQNVVWRIIRETSSQRLAIASGEANYVLDLTAEDMNLLGDAPGVVKVVEPTLQPFYLRMNSQHGPLADVNLRKAVSHVFNYDGMIDILEFADLLHGPFPGGLPGHNAEMAVYRTDLAKAKEYLAKSAYAQGGIKLRYVHVAGYEQQRRIGLLFLDSLRELGIELEIQALNWPDMVAEAGSPETQGDFMAVWQSSNYADLDNFAFPAFHSSQNGNWSNPVFKDPNIDAMIVAAREEAAQDRRVTIYRDMQQNLVDQATDIYCATLQRLIAHSDKLTGFSYTPIGTNAPEFFPLSMA